MKSPLSRSLLAIILTALSALTPAVSKATPVLGASVFAASDGNVVATFLAGAGASYNNDLLLNFGSTVIFNNHASSVGDTVDLGYFTAGTELIFELRVNSTGYSYFTGPSSRNPDGIAHAYVDDAYSATEGEVAFEDIFGGGDRNFRDMVFSFTNITSTGTVPDTGSTIALFSAGLIGLAALKRRR